MSDDSWKGACLQILDEVEAARAELIRSLDAPPEVLKQIEQAELTVKWTYS